MKRGWNHTQIPIAITNNQVIIGPLNTAQSRLQSKLTTFNLSNEKIKEKNTQAHTYSARENRTINTELSNPATEEFHSSI